jgi:hypothetical protein
VSGATFATSVHVAPALQLAELVHWTGGVGPVGVSEQ